MRKSRATQALVIALFLVCHAPPSRARQTAAAPPPQSADRPPPYYKYPFGSETTRERVLTLGEAVELALRQASTFSQAQLEERVAREDVRQARTDFLPKLSAPLTYLGNTPSQVKAPDEPLTFSYVSSSAINETVALFNAAGELDLSGRLRANLGRTRHLLAAARAGTQAARRELVLATVDAYYGLTLARQKRRLADETLSLAEGFARVAETLRERGEGEEPDALRARIEALKRRDEVEQARAAESAAMDALRTLTGVDYATHIAVKHITEDVPTAADFAGYTEEIVRSRPELFQVEAQRLAALDEARAARAERRPQFSYSLSGGFDAADLRDLRRFSGGQAILSLNVPLFDFGASRSREAQARLRAQQFEAQREATLSQLRQEFYTSRAAALSALERIRLTRAAAQAAQRNIALTLTRYRQKQSTILDVVDAQASYAEARTAFYQALTDYRTARIRLEVVPGP